MTYERREHTVGSSLLTHEQKVIPISGGPSYGPAECCCTNFHRPYILNGQWVTSLSPGCKVHSNTEIKWMSATLELEEEENVCESEAMPHRVGKENKKTC